MAPSLTGKMFFNVTLIKKITDYWLQMTQIWNYIFQTEHKVESE